MFELILQYSLLITFVYKFIELRTIQAGSFRLEFGKPRTLPQKRQVKQSPKRKQLKK